MNEPERWLTSKEAPGPMREMLSAAKQVGPSASQRTVLAGKLGVATSSFWLVPSLKGLAGVALVAGSVWVAAGAGPFAEKKAEKMIAPTITQAAPLAARAAPSVERPQLDEPPQPVEPPQPAQKTAAPSASSAAEAIDGARVVKPRPGSRTGTEGVRQPSETSLIAGAKNSLEAAPAEALGLLSQHAKLYPSGILAEEREVLRIRALKNLGREKDAARQEDKFRSEHPGSVHHVP